MVYTWGQDGRSARRPGAGSMLTWEPQSAPAVLSLAEASGPSDWSWRPRGPCRDKEGVRRPILSKKGPPQGAVTVSHMLEAWLQHLQPRASCGDRRLRKSTGSSYEANFLQQRLEREHEGPQTRDAPLSSE